jgi:Fur family peroxide stress response transcriptional regulator
MDAELRKAMRESGLKMTPQRALIYKALRMSKAHPSPASVRKLVEGDLPGVSLDTVYRTIKLFEEKGLVRRVYDGGPEARYDGDTGPHHHFVCSECGEVFDFEHAGFDRLEAPAGASAFGEVAEITVQVRGVCRKCLSLNKKQSGR